MTPADLHYLITNLPIVAAFVAGVWYADRRAQARGERIGKIEARLDKMDGRREAATHAENR